MLAVRAGQAFLSYSHDSLRHKAHGEISVSRRLASQNEEALTALRYALLMHV
jgi:hypothetical protein